MHFVQDAPSNDVEDLDLPPVKKTIYTGGEVESDGAEFKSFSGQGKVCLQCVRHYPDY